MAWVYLIAAGILEVTWAVGLKYTVGFTRLWPSVAVIAAMAISVLLLSWALREIPTGTGYAVWTGIGAAGTALLGILLFGESREIARLVSIGLIIVGVAGLRFWGKH